MAESSAVFSFDINQLYKNGEERCFEMNKAENYALPGPHHLAKSSSMYWIYGENTCPEMQMAIRMAKNKFHHLWPEVVSDLTVAELIFHIVTLQKSNQDLIEDNARLKDKIQSLEKNLKNTVTKRSSISEELMASVNDVSMCTACDQSTTPTNYYMPVPGVSTILACGEDARFDKDQSTAFTAKVRQGMEQLAQIFYDRDSVRQSQVFGKETLYIGDSTVVGADRNHLPRPPTPLRQRNSENSSHPRELQNLKDEPSLPASKMPFGYRPSSPKLNKEESQKPMVLQIFKDPEGIACRREGIDIQRQRHPRFSPTKQQPFQHLGEENLVPRCPPPLHETFNQLDLTGSKIDLVPCCASTAMFPLPKPALLPSPIAPTSGDANPILSPTIEPKLEVQPKKPQHVHQEFKQDDNDMEMENSPQSEGRTNSPLATAFNQFVHSPDQNGRLRIDATKFMDAFLTKKSKNPSYAGDRKWPPLF